jgi:hypothetical protein
MTPGQDYAPCPHCAANNVTYRQVCWRCGYALPYTIGLDGRPRVNAAYTAHTVSRTEIESLLNQAQTLDVQEERRRQEAADAVASASAEAPRPNALARLRALFGSGSRKERHSGA